MLAACLIGAIARAFDHGCKMQYVICLKGNQGLKKIRILASIIRGSFFLSSKVPSSVSGKFSNIAQIIENTAIMERKIKTGAASSVI